MSTSDRDRERRLKYRCTSQDSHARSVRLFVASSGFAGRVHTAEALERIFSPFGKVWDTRIGPSYGFVQYDNVDSAQKAIQALSHTRLDNHQITVKLAVEGHTRFNSTNSNQPPVKQGSDGRPYNGPGPGAPPLRIGPLPLPSGRHDYAKPVPLKREMPMADEIPSKRFTDEIPSKRFTDEIPSKRFNDELPSKRFNDEIPAKRFNDEYRSRAPTQLLYSAPTPGADLRPPYDCLLITGNERQRGYCEMIEKLLIEKSQMLTCIQVVAGENLLGKAVVEAAKKNIPYTISVNENNQLHRSITLNILHSSQPQEHRNMPLDDAIPFLGRSFDQFVETMKKKIAAAGEWVPPTQEMIQMLGMLMEGRQLSFDQMKKVERYILLLKDKARAIDAVTDPSLRASPKRNSQDFQKARSVERRHDEPRDRRREDRDYRDHRDRNRSVPREIPQAMREIRGGLPPPRPINAQPSAPSTGTLQDLVRARQSQQNHPSYTSSQSSLMNRPAQNITLDNDLVRKALELVAQTNMNVTANNSGAVNALKRSWFS